MYCNINVKAVGAFSYMCAHIKCYSVIEHKLPQKCCGALELKFHKISVWKVNKRASTLFRSEAPQMLKRKYSLLAHKTVVIGSFQVSVCVYDSCCCDLCRSSTVR